MPVRDYVDICIVADLAIGDKIKKISLIKMLNIRGPRIEPCGTPLITFAPELITLQILKVSKGAKIRNRYNQVPHLTQDTNGKVTNLQ